MLNCGSPGLISRRLASAEQTSFFFHPVQLYFELSDLLVEFTLQLCFGALVPLAPIRERFPQVVQCLLLPLRHLGRMHSIMRGDLVDRACSLDRFQRHLALESRLVLLPLFAHQSLPMRHRFYILFTCPVFGEYLILLFTNKFTTREIQPLKHQSCYFTASGIRAE